MEVGHQSRVPQQVRHPVLHTACMIQHCSMWWCRYRCWIMVWNAWTRYTATCQAKKRKKSTSDTLFSRLVVQRAWRGWREDWKRRKEKKEEKRFCCEWHVKWLKRRSWLRWQQALSVRVRGRAMELTALHYWASALERRVTCWSCDNYRVISLVCVCVSRYCSGGGLPTVRRELPRGSGP